VSAEAYPLRRFDKPSSPAGGWKQLAVPQALTDVSAPQRDHHPL